MFRVHAAFQAFVVVFLFLYASKCAYGRKICVVRGGGCGPGLEYQANLLSLHLVGLTSYCYTLQIKYTISRLKSSKCQPPPRSACENPGYAYTVNRGSDKANLRTGCATPACGRATGHKRLAFYRP